MDDDGNVCALGALGVAAGRTRHEVLAIGLPMTSPLIDAWGLLEQTSPLGACGISHFNNAPTTTKEDVLAWLLVGSRSTKAVELQRSYLALDWLAREHAPAWLSLRGDLKAHAVALRGLKPLTDPASCRAAQAALDAARDAAWAAARDALAPTVLALQASASDLVKRMVAIHEALPLSVEA